MDANRQTEVVPSQLQITCATQVTVGADHGAGQQHTRPTLEAVASFQQGFSAMRGK